MGAIGEFGARRWILVVVVVVVVIVVAVAWWTRDAERSGQEQAATPTSSVEGAAADTLHVDVAHPQLVEFAAPDYPEGARARGIAGTVQVRVLVGPDGEVREATVLAGVDSLLDAAALAAARASTWRPARQRGVPVEAWVALPVAFAPRDSAR